MYQNVQLLIDGAWGPAADGRSIDVLNPATDEVIGTVAHAGRVELERAVAAAERGFAALRAISNFERAKLLRRAGALCLERAPRIAELITLEQGKPLAEALVEAEQIAEHCSWMAGECERIYARGIPARLGFVEQRVIKDPVGPVALFTPWNFPTGQLVRKVASAIAAGCSLIAKAPEETPASCAEMMRAFQDAGLPAGSINLVYGTPAEISEYLIAHPSIRKISFTGSTAVGRHLSELAGRHLKHSTMELGGHGPVVVFDDADMEKAVARIAAAKFRNAGQVCTSPTRFTVQSGIYEEFVDRFVAAARAVKVGDGLEAGTQMGPLANIRRVQAMEGFVADAVSHGATVRTGGKRIGNRGNFFEPTVLTDVRLAARVMNEEPFGPLALIRPFETMDEAVTEANRLAYGLTAYAFTTSSPKANEFVRRVESGMVSINHFGCGLAETPLIGMKDSGYGYESGAEGIEAYLQSRFVTVADL
jgi:succinate-semialdehyde dehydrogenase / glutarate-semialdehyde dehydrogenase